MTLVQAELYGPVAADLPRVCEIVDARLASDEVFVQDLVERISRQRGKMLRPALVLLTGRALGRCTEAHYTLAAVLEMVHVASLVHDDVIDEAHSRRNVPSLNRTAGNEGAVLLGDYVMANAFRLCSSLRSHEANELLGATCKVICLGELMQVHLRGDLALSEAQYLEIITRKTAWLLRGCAMFGATFAQAGPARVDQLAEYGLNLGMAFQIADDMLDLVGSEEEMGKTLGRDLAKGELTLPLIRFMSSTNGSAHAEMATAIRSGGREGLRRIRQLLLEADALEYCGRLASEYTERAVSLLNDLPASEARDCLGALADFVQSRRC